jgi:hypothetical protein
MSSLTRSVRMVNTPELPKTEEIDWTTGAPIALELLPDEPPQDYEPSRDDYEWIAACNLASFMPRDLSFGDWINEKSRQAGLSDDARGQWLSRKIDELAKLAAFLGASDPETFDDRHGTYEVNRGHDTYHKGWKDGLRDAEVDR